MSAGRVACHDCAAWAVDGKSRCARCLDRRRAEPACHACQDCHEPFPEDAHRAQKRCEPCRKAADAVRARGRVRDPVPCAGCGVQIHGGKGSLPAGQRMCRACRRERKAQSLAEQPLVRMPRKSRPACEICGAAYTRSHSAQRTCGRGCGRVLQARNRTSRSSPGIYPSSRVKICQCVECGALFVARARSRKICSAACRAERAYRSSYGRNRLQAECLCCGGALPVGSYRTVRFCGTACRRSGKSLSRAKARARSLAVGRPMRSHRDRVRAFGGDYEYVDVRVVYERDRWVCQLCEEPVDPSVKYPDPRSASLDHVLPLARGGDHTYENVQLAHLSCNVRKGADESEEVISDAS